MSTDTIEDLRAELAEVAEDAAFWRRRASAEKHDCDPDEEERAYVLEALAVHIRETMVVAVRVAMDDKVERRWLRDAETPYSDLSEEAKAPWQREARRIVAVIERPTAVTDADHRRSFLAWRKRRKEGATQ